MFGFGWVRIHLGDVFLESIRVFFRFLEKMEEINKSRQFWGPMQRRRDPKQQRRSMPKRGMSMLRRS